MIEFRVPMEAPSTPNLREHHMVRAKRVKAQRGAVQRKMPKWGVWPLLVVRLTRVAPRELDGDNLQTAMKAVRDQVAAGLRIDDASPLVSWLYHQAKGEAEVVVQIWKAVEDAPPLPVGRPVERRRGKALAAVAADAGKRLRVVREPGKGEKRAPSGRCNKNGCRRLLPCADHSHHLLRHACDAPTEALAFARALNAQPNYNAPPNPRASRTNPVATKAMEPSNAAEHRVLLAAQEAEATFAPAPVPVSGERRRM